MLPSCVAAVVVCPYSTPVRRNVNGPGTTAAANSQRQSLYAEQEARAAPNFHVSGRQARAMKSTVPVCAFTRPSSGLFAYQWRQRCKWGSGTEISVSSMRGKDRDRAVAHAYRYQVNLFEPIQQRLLDAQSRSAIARLYRTDASTRRLRRRDGCHVDFSAPNRGPKLWDGLHEAQRNGSVRPKKN